MNTTSNDELEDFEKSIAPERFVLIASSNNVLLPPTNASVSMRGDSSVEIDWSRAEEGPTTASSEAIMADIERSVRRRLDVSPRSARAHANLGVALLKNGQAKEAILELSTALDLDPSNYLARITLARLHLGEGRTHDAEKAYEEVVRLHPNDAAAEIGLSIAMVQANRFDEAHDHLLKAVKLDKHNSQVRFLLGLVCLRKSNLRCALSEFRAALNLDLRNPSIYHAMGVAYTLHGDHLRAEKAFRTALALAPESPSTVVALARSMLNFQKQEKAIEILQDYLKGHEGDLEVRDQLACAYMEAGRYSASRSQILQMLELGEGKISEIETARHRTNLAVTFMHERSFKRAEAELKVAIQLAPNLSQIPYDNLARIYALTKRVPLAIEVLKRAFELFPASKEIRTLLSILYADQEDYWAAILHLETLRNEGALSDQNYAALGDAYLQVDESNRALEVLVEGYSKFPKSMWIINNLAYCLLEDGKISQAREVLETRPQNEEVRIEMTATLGLMHLKEGDYDGARRLYKRAESMAAKSSQKELARRVRQKMHLELAIHHARNKEYDAARREIRAGLQEKLERRSVAKELQNLTESMNRLS